MIAISTRFRLKATIIGKQYSRVYFYKQIAYQQCCGQYY